MPWWLWPLLGGVVLALLIAAGIWGAGLPGRLRQRFVTQRSGLQEDFFIAPSLPFLSRELEALVRRFNIPVL